ncbi:poly-beta-1,6-N-acetyl-D-glucosamine synthase [Xenophilus arseniciresistens]|uniref:Poly-beta-1,6-N-acetyl-D-glucosamine synthase n=1 Tax=Xenophilus arseniciresistens TaxID=1283306 RepID=A0AAE3NC68_9BURK|nr:poly-beta-1,6-N-acetyl-D-glucosamine synthase [Xenophilus arseniciresistens]MDA7418449.1 poly-beta-1,6-N-acetyl-D-glucosamine synthase [Xenophilus arseniciresistens]
MADFVANVLPGWLFGFVFYYPFFMAYVWISGGLAHSWVFEHGIDFHENPLSELPPGAYPLVTVAVPCFNEEPHVEQVVAQLMASHYPNFELIAINDGSSDRTGEILDALALQHPRLRVIHNVANQGKAVSLNTACQLGGGEYILGVDGDALVDPHAIAWMLAPMLRDERIGAVTGNPRIRTRTTVLGRMQVGEFSSIIGLIKRSQQLIGALFTVSGVLAMFRRKAVMEAGFWSHDVMTEDIDMSWRLQMRGWRLRFEPRALCWILMPETLRGLWRQRLRWAVGGIQTMTRYTPQTLRLRNLRLWPVYLEYMTSVLWAYAMAFVLLMGLLRPWLPEYSAWQTSAVPQWQGMLLALSCLLQMLTSLWIDRRYDRDLLRYYVGTIWYPIAFWAITMVATVVALPKALLRRRGKRAVWTSPDRGVTDA